MATRKEGLEAFFRGIERRLGIDREGRTVWVWLLPPAVGIVSAVLVAFMPGLPADLGWVYRLPFSLFAFVTMTLIASIYLITFDNDHNQQAAVDDDPGHGDEGPQSPPAPSGSPSPPWLSAGDRVWGKVPDDAGQDTERAPRERVPVSSSRS
ncbi:MAG: hypothetical protein ACHQ4F_07395 [Candidatus Dormibacteria bacterium]